MKWKPYTEYQESKSIWIGNIPCNWKLIRLGYKSKMIVPMRDKPPKFEGAVPWIRIEDFDGKYISDSKSKQYVSQEIVDSMNLKIFPTGTVLCSCSCEMGATAIVQKPLVSNQTFIGIVPGKDLNSDFLYYSMQHYSEYLQYLATGAIQQYLSREDFQQLRLFVPSIEEQQAIAAFLDRETERIDDLMAKKQRQIELLQEKRATLISQVVTRGLNPNVKMKDSGVEWLGDIPEHWEIKRLKYIGRAVLGLTYKPDDIVDENQGTLVLRSSNIQNGNISLHDNVYVKTDVPSKLITRKGDILICSRNGSRALIGKNAKITPKVEGVTFGAFMTVFRSKYFDYLYYILNSQIFEYQSAAFLTSTINQLTIDNLYSFNVPIPPICEQKQIVEHLLSHTTRIDQLMNKINSSIVLLQEYRSALISAAVTGKIDVRQEVN